MDLKCLVCNRQVHYAQLSTFESRCWLIAVTLPLSTLASLAHTLRPQCDVQQTSKPWSFYIKRPRVFIQQSKTGVLFRRGRRYFVTYWDNVWFTYFCNKFPCLVFHYHISHLPLNVIHKDKDKEKKHNNNKNNFLLSLATNKFSPHPILLCIDQWHSVTHKSLTSFIIILWKVIVVKSSRSSSAFIEWKVW